MKKIWAASALLISLGAAAQQGGAFSVDGNYRVELPVKWVYLTYRGAEGKNVTDSVQATADSKYHFAGKIAEPGLATLRVKYEPNTDGTPRKIRTSRDYAAVYLSPAKIDISSVDSFSNISVKGSAAHDEYVKINAALKPYNARIDALMPEYMKANSEKNEDAKSAVVGKIQNIQKESKQEYLKYVKANPSSPIALYAVTQYAGYDINEPYEIEKLLNSLSPENKNSASGKSLADRVEISKKTAIGRPALEFVQNDTLGKPVALSSLKGKYLLVDFWASWCGPCRAENPNVVKTYQAYKDKGFTVLGVSLDQPDAKDKWLKAIHDDNLTWTHVSDLKYWDNEVAKLYGIRAIPANLLLDRDGKIVAKNLRGEDLKKKLAELLP
ncbi:TlpA disulfide reductase family protein [Sediminibacterium ginsengisoli]|uniref:Peroxiredoxin n=1 Tax=Sediminibacterium ginsengisoli TaxID=413434 RepID=A0A1T4QSG2_9BACT|nr:TlpA disulfide reductase family protein [Sediminibacterium ginsengisoli]SKA06692.1 Peroxiredoxin [Sediminibacterium ginsengisoli]